MRIKAIEQLRKVEDWAPTVAGATAGLVGMSVVMDQAKAWTASMWPPVPGQVDYPLLAVRGIATLGAAGLFLATAGGARTDMVNKAFNAATVSACAVGGLSILVQGLGWTPITIGRVGATRPVGAVRGVNVVRKDIPAYTQVPTYAPAMESAAIF